MPFGRPQEYVLKTTVDEATYKRFARLAEDAKRSLSDQLRLIVEARLERENGRKK